MNIYIYIYLHAPNFVFSNVPILYPPIFDVFSLPTAPSLRGAQQAKGLRWFIPIGQSQVGPYLFDGSG